jgi:hypothetical protein
MGQLTSNQVFCRMIEYDLACNLDKGVEYTGFKKLYTDSMMKKGDVSQHGHVYDISKYWNSRHLIRFFKRLQKENKPEVTMTSGSFFSMNKTLQKKVVKQLKKLSEIGTVKLYVGEDINFLFDGIKNVQINIFDREECFIPHFIKTKNQFELALPHNEKKLVRVGIDSKELEKNNVQRIILYFDELIAELDRKIKNINNKVS